MRLALLCDDSSVNSWLQALVGDPDHEVGLAATLTPEMAVLVRGQSGIRLTNHWEELLGSRDFDAVLVGGSDPKVLEAIKQYATAGQPLLFLPQADQGSTFIYELSLIRDDNHVAICPAFWHRFDTALIGLRDQIRSNSRGNLRLLQLERIFPGTGGSSLVPQITLDRALLYDFDLLRWLVGDYDQVTALRTGMGSGGALTQSVKLAGRDLCEATWAGSAGSSESCKITAHFEQGRIQLERDAVSGEWGQIDPDGKRVTGNRRNAMRGLITEFAKTLTSNAATTVRLTSSMEWAELIKAFETVDATHRSVASRRTIELHFESMSERAIFKTQMTAMGCGVLVATFLLVLVYLGIASTVPLPQTMLLVLRTLVFAPLVIFLLLQALYPLARPSTKEMASDEIGESAS